MGDRMDGRPDSQTERQTRLFVEVVALNGVKKNSNKAVYKTASVTYGWAWASMQFRKLFGKNFNSMTDGPTDRPSCVSVRHISFGNN